LEGGRLQEKGVILGEGSGAETWEECEGSPTTGKSGLEMGKAYSIHHVQIILESRAEKEKFFGRSETRPGNMVHEAVGGLARRVQAHQVEK